MINEIEHQRLLRRRSRLLVKRYRVGLSQDESTELTGIYRMIMEFHCHRLKSDNDNRERPRNSDPVRLLKRALGK